MALLQKQNVAVNAFEDLVILDIAGTLFTFEFLDALNLSVAMRYHARLAKLSTGNTERGFYVAGVLHDASAEKPARKRFLTRIPEQLKAKDIRVGTAGQLVTVTIKGTTAKLPYSDARTLAQWLRVRGKEAKRNAGEHAHWSRLVNSESVERGDAPRG